MPHAPRLSPRRGSVYALIAVSLTAALTFSGISVMQGRGSAHAAEPDAESGPQPALVVAPESAVVESTAEQFRFEVLLKNPTSQPLGAGTVALTIDNHRAETAADLSPEGERESLELASVEAVATQGEKDQRIEVVVSRDDFPLLFTREAGVYPIHAEFQPSDAKADDAGAPNLTTSTAVVWNDAVATSPSTADARRARELCAEADPAARCSRAALCHDRGRPPHHRGHSRARQQCPRRRDHAARSP